MQEIADCVGVWAVTCEPVSTAIFSINREKYREFCNFSAFYNRPNEENPAGLPADCDRQHLRLPWVKTNPVQGAFYRSQHALIYLFKKGTDPHLNNVELGRFGPNPQ